MENFFIYSAVIKLVSCMILRNLIILLIVNRNISTGATISKEDFGLE